MALLVCKMCPFVACVCASSVFSCFTHRVCSLSSPTWSPGAGGFTEKTEGKKSKQRSSTHHLSKFHFSLFDFFPSLNEYILRLSHVGEQNAARGPRHIHYLSIYRCRAVQHISARLVMNDSQRNRFLWLTPIKWKDSETEFMVFHFIYHRQVCII